MYGSELIRLSHFCAYSQSWTGSADTWRDIFVCLCAVGARCHVVVCDYEEGGCLVEENYERDEFFGGILDLY